MTRSNAAAVRSIHDRVARAQRTYAQRLRDAVEALSPLVDDGDAAAVELTRAIESELKHIAFGSAIVDE